MTTRRRAAAAASDSTPSKLPLEGFKIVLSGKFNHLGHSQGSLEKLVRTLGGSTASSVTSTTTHLICTEVDYNGGTKKVEAAKASDLPILDPQWVLDAEGKTDAPDAADYSWTTKANNTATANGNADTKADTKANAKANAKADTKANGKSNDADAPAKKRKASVKDKPETKKAKGAKGKRKAKDEDDDVEMKDEEDEDEDEKMEDFKEEKMVAEGQFIKKKDSEIPVDDHCPWTDHKVHIDPDTGMIWDASLNQTNASHNNNKFYRLQILYNPKTTTYKTWTRWGRVGETGQSATLPEGPLANAIKGFEKKFRDKSGLSWDNRGENPKPGKYAFVERSYNPDDSDDDEEEEKKASTKIKDEDEDPPVECTLEKPIQDLMGLIFNLSYFQAAMSALNYDANKLPLGKLSKSTITRGFQQLKDLAALMDDPSLANSLYFTSLPSAREQLSNTFYSLIPHAFGRNRPPIISNNDMLKKEIELLESLSDMKDAADIMKVDRKSKDTVHPLDLQFRGLGLQEMTTLDHSSQEFSLLESYLHESRGQTHHINYKVEHIWRIERDGEKDRFDQSSFSSIKSDRRLLWHGSRCTNFGGILSQGLRIAPPEAPVSGYMFGKGIYLADMSSKSAGYCCSYISNGHILLLLCEAELGDPMQKLTHASYEAGETAKKNGMVSTLGQGNTGPTEWVDASQVHESLSGVKMPDSKVSPGPTNVQNASLYYNEYIAYDVAQVRLRYLFRVKV